MCRKSVGSVETYGQISWLAAGFLAVGGNALFAADIPGEGETPEVSWSTVIDAVPISLAAADDKLFVMTVEGKLIVLSMEDTIYGSEIIVDNERAGSRKKGSRPDIYYFG